MPTLRSARGAGTSGKIGTLRPSASVATQVSDRLSTTPPAGRAPQLDASTINSMTKRKKAKGVEQWRRIGSIRARKSLRQRHQNSARQNLMAALLKISF